MVSSSVVFPDPLPPMIATSSPRRWSATHQQSDYPGLPAGCPREARWPIARRPFCRTIRIGLTTNAPLLSTPNAAITERLRYHMRHGVIADVHGNEVALRAVLDDAAGCRRRPLVGPGRPGPVRPASGRDAPALLPSLPGVEMLRGNTDRYVLTGQQPAPHATAADAAGQRRPGRALRSGGGRDRLGPRRPGPGGPARRAHEPASANCAWTCLTAPRVLGVHASPGRGRRPRNRARPSRRATRPAAGGLRGRHRHRRAHPSRGRSHDRPDPGAQPRQHRDPGAPGRGRLAPPRPRPPRGARTSPALPGARPSVGVEHRTVPFDVDAVVRDLRRPAAPERRVPRGRPHRTAPAASLIPPVIVIVGGLICFPMLILGPIGERIVG